MKKIIIAAAIAATLILTIGCGAKRPAGRPESMPRPDWTDAQAQAAIDKLADEYRRNGADDFWQSRTYVWSDTWVWPETIGVGEAHLPLLKKMFGEGDDATREVVLSAILMNIPADRLKNANKDFLRELVLLATEIKESRANVPPPRDHETIEEYVQ